MKSFLLLAFFFVAGYAASIDTGVGTDVKVDTGVQTSQLPDYVQKVTDTMKGAVDMTGNVVNGAIGTTGEGVQGGIKIGSDSAKLGIKIGKEVLNGVVDIGQTSVDVGSKVTDKAFGIVKDVVGNGVMGNATQKAQELVDNILHGSKNVWSNVGKFGDKVFDWMHHGVEQGTDMGNKITNSVVDTAQSTVSKATSAVNKGIDIASQSGRTV